jgi:hypothetical protein
MTDWFFDQPTLEKMGEDVASGHPPTLAPETRESLINRLRESGVLEDIARFNAISGDGG